MPIFLILDMENMHLSLIFLFFCDIIISVISGWIYYKYMNENLQGSTIDEIIHTPLDGRGNESMAKRFLEGGYRQSGYGVAAGAAVDGSFAIGTEGNKGYYVGKTDVKGPDGRYLSGRDVFLSTVDAMKQFFVRLSRRNGKSIKYVIKPGIGGQHTPFQGIADCFGAVDAAAGKIAGEYELGKDYESALITTLKELGADWDQIAVIPSSKSGSTDETMIIFNELLYVMLKNIAAKENIDGQKFADVVFNTMHEVNFVNGVERPGKDLFKEFNLSLVTDRANAAGLSVTYEQIKSIFGRVLGNMFFETTDRPSQSHLSAFIRNSGLDTELGEDAPGFGAMFDNVGGRWTADLHMMTFLAYHNLDAESYWNTRYEGIKKVRDGKHIANELGNQILDEGITDIALVVPDELFWFGKAMEQNFNESIWQDGFANLIAIKQSMWESQKANYADKSNRIIINISSLEIPQGRGFNVVALGAVSPKDMNKQQLANGLGELFTLFYGITHTVGNRLIARALSEKGFSAVNVDISDLDNPATKIVQANLYLRQPYVELGKGLLETNLKELQKKEQEAPGAIEAELNRIKEAAKDRGIESNIPELNVPARISSVRELIEVIKNVRQYAEDNGRKIVPFIYLEGDKFYDLRDHLITLGIEWVMQGTGDQHISYQQVLAQPKKYLPFIISFVPEETVVGRPAIGFAKGYLHSISPNMVRDSFAEASYKALTELRKEEGGHGLFLRMTDSQKGSDIAMFKKAFVEAMKPVAKTETTKPANRV